jgi:hypothetical protein
MNERDDVLPWYIRPPIHAKRTGFAGEWAGYDYNQLSQRRRETARLRVLNLGSFPADDVVLDGMFSAVDCRFADEAETQHLMPLWEATVKKWLIEGI